MSERICNHRWVAPRIEAPNTMPVNHVCAQVLEHRGVCVCSCGAVELRLRENPPLFND